MGKDQLGEVRGLCEGPICLPHQRRLPSFSAGRPARGRWGGVAGTSGCAPSSELRGKELGTRSRKCAASSPRHGHRASERALVTSERGDRWGRVGSGGEASGGEERGAPGTMRAGPLTDGVSEGFFPQLLRQLRGGRVPPPRSPCPAPGDPSGWVAVPAAPQLPPAQQWGLVGERQHVNPGFPSRVVSADLPFEALSVGQRLLAAGSPPYRAAGGRNRRGGRAGQSPKCWGPSGDVTCTRPPPVPTTGRFKAPRGAAASPNWPSAT